MNLNPFRKMLGLQQKPVYYPPTMKGPPDSPEFFVLLHQSGKWPKSELDERHFIRNLKEERELFDLRRARYASLFPGVDPDLDYSFSYEGMVLNPEHLPNSIVLKKKVKLTEHAIVGLPLSNGITQREGRPRQDHFRLVRPAFKEAIEALDPQLCQFFPFEFRLDMGAVIETFFVMHFPKKHLASVVMEKSGARKMYHTQEHAAARAETWTWPDDEVVRTGQLVIRRPPIPHVPLYFTQHRWQVYSKALAERLQQHIPEIDAFYAVHVDEDS